MSVVSISDRIAGGSLQQHFYAEPTAVAEACSPHNARCFYDDDCCAGLICEWTHCRLAG